MKSEEHDLGQETLQHHNFKLNWILTHISLLTTIAPFCDLKITEEHFVISVKLP